MVSWSASASNFTITQGTLRQILLARTRTPQGKSQAQSWAKQGKEPFSLEAEVEAEASSQSSYEIR